MDKEMIETARQDAASYYSNVTQKRIIELENAIEHLRFQRYELIGIMADISNGSPFDKTRAINRVISVLKNHGVIEDNNGK